MSKRIYHVTVEQKHVLTYEVTSEQPGITDETAAFEFISTADAETLDKHEVHEETLALEISGVEDVTG